MQKIFGKVFKRKNHKENENITLPKPVDSRSDIYSADGAIRDPNLDEFNRKEFSERIAQTIAARKENQSLIIGLYGKWGEGKSTVLNFIETELKRHANVVTLNFNPCESSP